jgi:hypothetical protein
METSLPGLGERYQGKVRDTYRKGDALALVTTDRLSAFDRVLTTNFDPLVLRACAMLGEFPAVYDFAISQLFRPGELPDRAIFHLHGQSTGFVLMNTDEEVKTHSERLGPLFQDAGQARPWIVVGYSGDNDPVFNHLAAVERFDYCLFWEPVAEFLAEAAELLAAVGCRSGRRQERLRGAMGSPGSPWFPS